MDDNLNSGYYEPPVGYDDVDWLDNEVMKSEKKMAFFYRNTKKDIIMTEEDEEDFKKKITFVDFVKKKQFLIKLKITVI